MVNDFLKELSARRSRYALSARSPISDEAVTDIIRNCVSVAPSAFNSQSARVLVLFGDNHKKLWDITRKCLQQIVPADKFAPTEEKLSAFEAAYGTILYFEDQSVVKGLQERFALYKDKFPVWAQQSDGMLQFAVWTALAQAGLGASLQHYNPVIDARVREAFNVPAEWELVAQMPFGQPTEEAQPKEVAPLDKRVIVWK